MEINTLIDTYRAQWLLLVSPACRVSAHESEYPGSNTATEGSGTDEIFYNLVRGLFSEINISNIHCAGVSFPMARPFNCYFLDIE